MKISEAGLQTPWRVFQNYIRDNADGWKDMLLPEIERQQKQGKEVVFRADAAFAKPEIYEALEERGVGMRFAFRPTIVWRGTSQSC